MLMAPSAAHPLRCWLEGSTIVCAPSAIMVLVDLSARSPRVLVAPSHGPDPPLGYPIAIHYTPNSHEAVSRLGGGLAIVAHGGLGRKDGCAREGGVRGE